MNYSTWLNILKILTLLCAGFTASFATAQSEQDSRWQLSLGVGLGVRTNPVMDNADIPLVLVPQISYQGDHFFIQNLDVGYALYQDQHQQFSVLLTPSYDQVFFNNWDANNFIVQNETTAITKELPGAEPTNHQINKQLLHNRRMAALAGLEYNVNWNDVDLQVQALREVTGYYAGHELRMALSKSISVGKHDVKLTLGANWQSAETLSYFYGLEEEETVDSMPYKANPGVTTLLRFDWNYQLNERWGLRFFTSYRHLSDPIINSPLLTNDNVITAFAGGVYHF